MKRILFVDDEPMVLEGLQRMLRPLRHEWQMSFAPGGHEALAMLAKEPFDVIVSDMRMPVMDGAQLLEEVRKLHPHIVRIVLTGQCNRDAVLKVMSLAHRHLAKPCEAESLKETVTRACALQELLNLQPLLALASRLKSVPSMPSLYLEVVKELESREPSLKRVGYIISQDIGMTAKIMQVANSAFFGLRSKASNPAQAVMLLGSETTRVLVLAANIFSRFDPAVAQFFSVDALWSHSMQTSDLARRIAKAQGANELTVEYAAMAGLLHDAGKLILVAYLPKAYEKVVTLMKEKAQTTCEAERVMFEATHAEIGAYLLGLWGLPNLIVEAVAWHHRPNDCPGETFTPLTAVHVANALIHEAAPESKGRPQVGLDHEYLRRLGLADRLEDWRALQQEPAAGEKQDERASAVCR